jgi:hypothetical protein
MPKVLVTVNEVVIESFEQPTWAALDTVVARYIESIRGGALEGKIKLRYFGSLREPEDKEPSHEHPHLR